MRSHFLKVVEQIKSNKQDLTPNTRKAKFATPHGDLRHLRKAEGSFGHSV